MNINHNKPRLHIKQLESHTPNLTKSLSSYIQANITLRLILVYPHFCQSKMKNGGWSGGEIKCEKRDCLIVWLSGCIAGLVGWSVLKSDAFSNFHEPLTHHFSFLVYSLKLGLTTDCLYIAHFDEISGVCLKVDFKSKFAQMFQVCTWESGIVSSSAI